ncbi:MAG: IgGFc-binding protein [Chitinophagaceae bacterium]|nr:IgGFc-binding protein [Chitinophagaceae bacterium]
MRKLILLSITVILSFTAFSQDFSNKGKDFWLCFPNHVPSSNNATLSIFITSDLASSGTITMPNSAFSGTFNITANGIQEIQIPWSASIHISNGESSNESVTQILNKSIHIKTDPGQPAVVAYAQQWAGARSTATLLLPVNVLGKKYHAISFTQNGSNGGGVNARSQFQVIAINDNTDIRITPVKNGVVGTPFTINLPLAGNMIQYQSPDATASTQDLTGTLIESIATAHPDVCLLLYSPEVLILLLVQQVQVAMADLMILCGSNYIQLVHGVKVLGLFHFLITQEETPIELWHQKTIQVFISMEYLL